MYRTTEYTDNRRFDVDLANIRPATSIRGPPFADRGTYFPYRFY